MDHPSSHLRLASSQPWCRCNLYKASHAARSSLDNLHFQEARNIVWRICMMKCDGHLSSIELQLSLLASFRNTDS